MAPPSEGVRRVREKLRRRDGLRFYTQQLRAFRVPLRFRRELFAHGGLRAAEDPQKAAGREISTQFRDFAAVGEETAYFLAVLFFAQTFGGLPRLRPNRIGRSARRRTENFACFIMIKTAQRFFSLYFAHILTQSFSK